MLLQKSPSLTPLQAKQALNKFVPKSFDPSKIEGKIDDKKELRKVVEKVVRENKKVVDSYKSWDDKALNYLMGEIMNATNRRADFRVARKVLEETLEKVR